MNYKQIIFSALLACTTTGSLAQKITLGNCTTPDGGQYKGEIVSGKAHGKGKATYKNCGSFLGEFGKRCPSENAEAFLFEHTKPICEKNAVEILAALC